MWNTNLPPTPPASLEAFDPEAVILKLTLDEKIGLLSGINSFLYSNFSQL
jgi:beta-glucosidase